MLFSGNFAYALSHASCKSDENIHHKCEEDCCEESDCFTGDDRVVKFETSGGCCEVHIEKSIEQDFTLPVVNNSKVQLKQEYFTINYPLAEFKPVYYELIFLWFKTNNIYLSISSLLI